ncbi:glycosyltransferase family 2 protein [Teredinibacter waterburyi]|jgi:Glycosyltransferases involved in cell wall biogenesis|uniref:glycosyltransferase family 2 protein n=1 Tax=Teredinibacter waterburyi TaxID=1500538 RepID=UPI00165FE09F|nr:glycosyltransferase family 2 protein [Teredinibacter waterburyi]
MSNNASDKKLLSLLVPMYNESSVIPIFFETVTEVLTTLKLDYEIVCVNDGSTDNTLQLLLEYSSNDPRIKVVSFSRNFGKEPAMTAALDYATGDAMIPIDADLQDPPELIHEMIAKWDEGFDVVYAKRASRETDTVIKRNTAMWFYSLFNSMSDTDIPANVGDYRLMDKKVVEVIRKLPEKDRFMKGLFCWPGFKNTTVEFERPLRAEGETKFNMWKLWNFALSGIASFSTMPIRMGIYLGLFISAASFLYGIFIISKTVLFGVDVAGYASMMVAVLFLGGIQLFFLGLMGEYIGRIYKEVKNRPLYVVERTIGFEQ